MRREWQIVLLVSGLLALPFAISSWNALFAPKGTPKEIIDKLNELINALRR